MNFDKFRHTGELSDITVIVEQREFKLHTFPLFIKSNYFKKLLASTEKVSPFHVDIGNDFPGGAQIFDIVADYLYSIEIRIDQNNVVPLGLAARFIECDALSELVEKNFDNFLMLEREKNDLNLTFSFLKQFLIIQKQLTEQTSMVEKCLETIVEIFMNGVGLSLTTTDRANLANLPLEWFIKLIELCPNENKLAILPAVKHYLTARVLGFNEGVDQSNVFVPISQEEAHQISTDQEKRMVIDEIVKVLGNEIEQMPLIWLNSVYEKALELNCECTPILISNLAQALLHSNELDNGLEKIPDDVMTQLLQRIHQNKNGQIKDPELLAKITGLTDTYVEQLRARGQLTNENFIQLASCVPKEQRSSHDVLLRAVDDILKNEKSMKISSLEREELLNQIDFTRISEETISACRNNDLIPQQLITDAALSLCTQLRIQLNETESRLRLVETQLARQQFSYVASSTKTNSYPWREKETNYRSRPRETSSRLSYRSRSNYNRNYDLLRNLSSSLYSRYQLENDLDDVPSSRYVNSSTNHDFRRIYSSHYY